MATKKQRIVKDPPYEDNITKEQAKAAVEAVQAAQKFLRITPVPKEYFTDKPAAEVWTDVSFKQYLAYIQDDYNHGGPATREYQWKNLNELIDDVLSGRLFVENP
jgi:hypothetical protein